MNGVVVSVARSVVGERGGGGSSVIGELSYSECVWAGVGAGVASRGEVKIEIFGRDRLCGESDVREGVVVVGVPRLAEDTWGRGGGPKEGELVCVECM